MPREAFDVCNMLVVPSQHWDKWKKAHLKTVKKGGKECIVFNSDAAVDHFKTAKTGRPTQIDDASCTVRYCSKTKPDVFGAADAALDLGYGTTVAYKYAGQYIGCYVGTASVVDFGKCSGLVAWTELDGEKAGEPGNATNACIDFACDVWGLDPKKVKGDLK